MLYLLESFEEFSVFFHPKGVHMLPTVLSLQFQPGQLAKNAAGLCELHQLIEEEDVPVEHFRICADGKEIDACVGPGRYRTALFLFHLMAGAPNQLPRFHLTRVMQLEEVRPYFDFKAQPEGVQPPGSDATMGPILLRSASCWVELTLKPGYERHMAAFRTPQEVIDFAWENHELIDFRKPLGLLRAALTYFFNQGERTPENPAGSELGPEFAGKVLFLQRRLTAMSDIPAYS
jgi:hypothetical protein